MGKRKARNDDQLTDIAGNENTDVWLSTRHKTKILPPPTKGCRRRRYISKKVPRSPLVCLLEDTPSPAQLKTVTRQTSIVDFFNPPRLRPLPLQDDLKCENFDCGPTFTGAMKNEDDDVGLRARVTAYLYSDFDGQEPMSTQREIIPLSPFAKAEAVFSPSEDRVNLQGAASPKYKVPQHNRPVLIGNTLTKSSDNCRVRTNTDSLLRAEIQSNKHEIDELPSHSFMSGKLCVSRTERIEDAGGNYDNFIDSLQTPSFLRGEHSTFDVDRLISSQMPPSNCGYVSHSGGESFLGGNEDSLRPRTSNQLCALEVSTCAKDLEFSQSLSVDSLSEYESCQQTPRLSAGNLADSLVTPTFPDSQLSPRLHSCPGESNSQDNTLTCTPTSLERTQAELDDLQTPAFLRGTRQHSDSSDCEL